MRDPSLAGRLLVVMAHPDDESFACGGTIARVSDEGHEVTLVCATRGGAGTLPPGPVAEAATARLALMAERERELQRAAAILGIARVELLGYRDGFLKWTPPGTLDREIANVLRDVRPDALVTFGRDGMYWHPDHIAIWERATAAAARATSCKPALYHVVIPPGMVEGLVADVRATTPAARERLWDIPSGAFGMLAPAPTLTVDVSPVIDRKLSALRAHASQVGASHLLANVDRAAALRWLGTECFRHAPESPAPRSFLDDFASPGPTRG